MVSLQTPEGWLAETVKGKTFDDFLISPGWGAVGHRSDISLSSHFSTKIKLNIPVVSANMDTITGSRMAITMAKEGGLGIIHRYLSIEDQCKKVQEVKRQEGFIIHNPYSISPDRTVVEAREIMAKNKVGSLVVRDPNGKLLGLLSSRDVRFSFGSQSVSDRMTSVKSGKLIFADFNISIEEARRLMDKHRLEKLPLVDKGFSLVGLITSRDIENIEKYPLANKDSNGRLVVGAAIGATGDYLERTAELIRAGVDVVVLDIANAQSVVGENSVREFRKIFPGFELMVGNIVLPEAVTRYQHYAVNGLKIGLGPGSACTTRKHTNIGVPQAQAVYQCAKASYAIPINADGGVKRDGHLGLALLLGASSVMVGGRFAGTDETPGLVFRNSNGEEVKIFRGMASREAMYDKLRAEEADDPFEVSSRINPEGMEKQVKRIGSVVPIIREMVGHLASMISYLGATSLQEAKELFSQNPDKYLITLSESSKRESFER